MAPIRALCDTRGGVALNQFGARQPGHHVDAVDRNSGVNDGARSALADGEYARGAPRGSDVDQPGRAAPELGRQRSPLRPNDTTSEAAREQCGE
jgi:hypothetical protein